MEGRGGVFLCAKEHFAEWAVCSLGASLHLPVPFLLPRASPWPGPELAHLLPFLPLTVTPRPSCFPELTFAPQISGSAGRPLPSVVIGCKCESREHYEHQGLQMSV